MFNDLKTLSDPTSYKSLIDIKSVNKALLISFLEKMLLIRSVEYKVANLIKNKIINCPCHLCVGQEAISVGILSHCVKGDMVYGNHRSHGHYIALGGNLKKFFLELEGKPAGSAGGMGGSMHLVDRKVGFEGSVPIVGGTIPIAVGAALKSKIKKDNTISVAFFGDGACEEGSFHESLNFASLHSLPVIFVAENNLFSSHLDIHLRQPSNKLSRFADAHKIQNYTIDGNDVVKIHNTVKKIIKKLRKGSGPIFLECVTFRHFGHVGHDENIDVGVKRTQKDIINWKKIDPILRLSKSLDKNEILSFDKIQKVNRKISDYVERIYRSSEKIEITKSKNIKKFSY